MDTEKNNSKTTDSYLDLPITLGTELIIELINLKLCIKSEVVGVENGQYIIIKLSSHDLMGNFRSDAVKESPMLIKYHHNGVIYGFKASILNVVSTPARLFFINYPETVEEFHVVNSSRFECNLPANAMFGYRIVEMVIIDISKEGCLCAIKTSSKDDELYNLIQVNKKIDMKVQLPGATGRLDLTGNVRNVSKDVDKILVGVKFEEVTPAVKEKLENFASLLTDVQKKQ